MFLTTLLECSVVMSIISLVYMIAIPLLSKRYSANWLYYIWFVIIVGWAFPFRPHFNTNLFTLQIPRVQVIDAKYMDVGKPLKVITPETSAASAISIWWVVVSIWAICAVGMIAYNAWQHYRFLKMVNRWSEDIKDLQALDLLNTLRREMNIKNHVGLKICPAIYTPMMIGFFRPTILLPSIKIDSEELTFILRHELVHLKRNDLWYKALISLITAIHWFNPIVHIIAKVIAVQCEISCDELLVKETNLEQRKQYGQTIIGVVRSEVGLKTALSTNFYKDESSIKIRIFQIMDATRKKSGITVLCIALITIMGSGMVFAASPVMNKKVINVDVKSLEGRKFVCVDETYTFEEGDIIQYNAPVQGDNKKVTIKFVREDAKTSDGKGQFQHLTLSGCYDQNHKQCIKVTKSQAGSYCLIIENDDEGVLSDIKGNIQITKGNDD
ncbi:MAG: family metallopeptidase [Neobacillus sp.]|nr:family metallopeptidase [Neobacillus sp.]